MTRVLVLDHARTASSHGSRRRLPGDAANAGRTESLTTPRPPTSLPPLLTATILSRALG